MPRELEIEVLMQDRATKAEAEQLLKKGTMIYENPEEYFRNLKECDCYNGENMEDIRAGKGGDLQAVTYNGKEYLVVYVN